MEQSRIKGKPSSYYKKSENKTIEKISKYINLGVNSEFNVNDVAYVLSETEYTDLTGAVNTDAVKELTELKETLRVKETEITKLTDKITTLEASNKELSDTIGATETQLSELRQLIQQKEKELSKYSNIDVDKLQQIATELETTNKELLGKVTNRDEYIIYLELLQTDYKVLVQYLNTSLMLHKQRNLINRVINKDVASDMDKPQLEMIDSKGNVLADAEAPIITLNKDKVNKSE